VEAIVADKETPNERRLREEKELDKLNPFGIEMRYGRRGPLGKMIDKLSGDDGGYGTSRGAGARYAGRQVADEMFSKEGATVGETMSSPRVRQAMREAAAEERREAVRGKKKGGVVSASKRADGCAQRGKTRGKMV
jgi:hypothetical protein